jgi:hypothetical protein
MRFIESTIDYLLRESKQSSPLSAFKTKKQPPVVKDLSAAITAVQNTIQEKEEPKKISVVGGIKTQIKPLKTLDFHRRDKKPIVWL